jgi:hypothetical protein
MPPRRHKTRGKTVFVLDAEHAIIISKIDAAYVYELMAIHAGALSPRLDAQGEMDFCQRA